jgi:hypothetical protein
MIDDLVQRLRVETDSPCDCGLCSSAREAADRIEALEADQKEEDTAFKGLLDAHRNALPRIEALEAALREIEQHPLTDGFAIREIARQALEAK